MCVCVCLYISPCLFLFKLEHQQPNAWKCTNVTAELIWPIEIQFIEWPIVDYSCFFPHKMKKQTFTALKSVGVPLHCSSSFFHQLDKWKKVKLHTASIVSMFSAVPLGHTDFQSVHQMGPGSQNTLGGRSQTHMNPTHTQSTHTGHYHNKPVCFCRYTCLG